MQANNPTEKRWITIVALILSGLGIVYFLVQTIVLGLLSVISTFQVQVEAVQNITTSLLVWWSLLSALVLVPTFVLSILQLKQKTIPTWLDLSQPKTQKRMLWIMLIWPALVGLGWLVAGNATVAAFLLGFVNILIVSVPLLWIYNLAQRDLKAGSRIRKWRIFGFSATVMPMVVMALELLVLLGIFLVAVVVLGYQFSNNPDLQRQMMDLVNQLEQAADMDAILNLLQPYLLKPAVIVAILVIVAGLMPLIEELFKPMALWVLVGRKISPSEGFVGGLPCGAGFALVENVLYFSTAFLPEDWLFTAIGRVGTGVLHMLGSGLVGWGLAKAWTQKKWLYLFLNPLIAFMFHGLWNALALAAGFVPMVLYGEDATLGQTILWYVPLIVLLILSFTALLLINRHLRKRQTQEALTTQSETDQLPLEAA